MCHGAEDDLPHTVIARTHACALSHTHSAGKATRTCVIG